jgi:hypothetical protein
LENAVLLRLEFKRAGNSVKADKSQIQCDADKDYLKLSKVLFDCEQFRAIQTYDNELRAWVLRRCLSVASGFSGVYVLPLSLLESVESKLAAASDERSAYVAAFLAVYDAEREAARVRLGGQYDERDYPNAESMRAKFGLTWRYVTFQVPENLPPEIAAREREARAKSFQDMESECREALRVGLAELLGHLSASLAVGSDGKPKIFRDTAVGNVVEFLDLLSARDITNDGELRGLAEKAKAIIGDATPERLKAMRTDMGFRAAMREQVASVAGAVAGLVGVESKRKFDLE